MTTAPKLCFDKVLPQQTKQPLRTRRMPDGRVRAIHPIGKKWLTGSTLKIRFLDGTDHQKALVQEFAPEWTEHANLNFEFTDDPRAEIRVTFDPDDGAWSYVGTDNRGIPLHAATLNLGWQDQGVILHEFGHMIGLAHEHSSPKGGSNGTGKRSFAIYPVRRITGTWIPSNTTFSRNTRSIRYMAQSSTPTPSCSMPSPMNGR